MYGHGQLFIAILGVGRSALLKYVYSGSMNAFPTFHKWPAKIRRNQLMLLKYADLIVYIV